MTRSRERELLHTAAQRFGTPLYVYSEDILKRQATALISHFPGFDVQYAMKVNSNPGILKVLRGRGLGVECVSLGELKLATASGFKAKDISFTCSNLTEAELVAAAATGARINLDSLHQLEIWGKRRLGNTVSLRINQGIGKGAHEHWVTGGSRSKFGISLTDLPKAKEIATTYQLQITGLHQHIGSNVLDTKPFLTATQKLLDTAAKFPDLEHISFGGGFGVPYGKDEKALDIRSVGREMVRMAKAFEKKRGTPITFSIEPGRYVVAEAGTLLVSVVDTKATDAHIFVGVNSGFNHLVRPVMYGAHHSIQNLNKRTGKLVPVTIAGNLCESGDIFAWDRPMPLPEIGDVLAIQTAGSCGFSMASLFNMRGFPKEVLITSSGSLKDISFTPTDFAL